MKNELYPRIFENFDKNARNGEVFYWKSLQHKNDHFYKLEKIAEGISSQTL